MCLGYNFSYVLSVWQIWCHTHYLNRFHVCRREELYSDADKFRPERFIDAESDDRGSNSLSYRFVPFIYGPRQCLGHRMAIVEMRAVLATLLRRFQFDLDPAGPAFYRRLLRFTMRIAPPLKLRVSLVGAKWRLYFRPVYLTISHKLCIMSLCVELTALISKQIAAGGRRVTCRSSRCTTYPFTDMGVAQNPHSLYYLNRFHVCRREELYSDADKFCLYRVRRLPAAVHKCCQLLHIAWLGPEELCSRARQ